MNADYLTRDVSDFAIVKAAARHLAEWKQGVLESLRQDRHLLLCAGAYYAGALVFLAATGNLGLWQTSMSRSALLPELPYLLIAAALAVRAFAKGDLRSFLSPVRTAQGFTVLLLYSLLHPLFFAVKGSIWYRIKDSGWDYCG